MIEPIQFFVEGEPKAQPRIRVTKRGHAYTPDSADEWKESVRAEAAGWVKLCKGTYPLMCPLKVTLLLYMPRPKDHFEKKGTEIKAGAPSYHAKKPDLDNAIKAILDAITASGLWGDDKQVAYLKTVKTYADERTGCLITIEELPRTLTEQ